MAKKKKKATKKPATEKPKKITGEAWRSLSMADQLALAKTWITSTLDNKTMYINVYNFADMLRGGGDAYVTTNAKEAGSTTFYVTLDVGAVSKMLGERGMVELFEEVNNLF